MVRKYIIKLRPTLVSFHKSLYNKCLKHTYNTEVFHVPLPQNLFVWKDRTER